MKKILLGLFFTLCISNTLLATTHTVVKGDTLWDIAGTYYSKNSLWPAISDVNSLANPNSVPIGTVLTIPSKSDAEAICNETDATKKAELIAKINGGTTSDTSTETETDANNNTSNRSKVKYEAPTAEQTDFDSYLNGDIDEKSIVGVSDSDLESSEE